MEGLEGRRRERRKETSKQELYTQDKYPSHRRGNSRHFQINKNSKSLSPANSNINKRKNSLGPKRNEIKWKFRFTRRSWRKPEMAAMWVKHFKKYLFLLLLIYFKDSDYLNIHMYTHTHTWTLPVRV